MTRKCCIVGCTSNIHKKQQYTNTFGFPKDAEKKELWVKAINRKGFVPDERSFVCIKHFDETDLIRKTVKFRSSDGGYVMHKSRFILMNDDVCPKYFPDVPEHVAAPSASAKPKKIDYTTSVAPRECQKRKAAVKCSETWRKSYNLNSGYDSDMTNVNGNSDVNHPNKEAKRKKIEAVTKSIKNEKRTDGDANEIKFVNKHYHKKFGLITYSDIASAPTSQTIIKNDTINKNNKTPIDRVGKNERKAKDAKSETSLMLEIRLPKVQEPVKKKNESSALPKQERKSSFSENDFGNGLDEKERSPSPMCPKMKFIRNLNLRRREEITDENKQAVNESVRPYPVKETKKRFSAMRSINAWRQVLKIEPSVLVNTSRSPVKKKPKQDVPKAKSTMITA